MPEEVQRASMEATSARTYDQAIGTHGFESLIPLLSGQLLLVDGDASSALAVFQHIDFKGLPDRLHAILLADIATCCLAIGRNDEAEGQLQLALSHLDQRMDADDAAYALCRLSQVCKAIGRTEESVSLAKRAESAIQDHRSSQRSLLSQLVQLVETGPLLPGPK
jgi:tetratricopeptide (TPR) repeat protein